MKLVGGAMVKRKLTGRHPTEKNLFRRSLPERRLTEKL